MNTTLKFFMVVAGGLLPIQANAIDVQFQNVSMGNNGTNIDGKNPYPLVFMNQLSQTITLHNNSALTMIDFHAKIVGKDAKITPLGIENNPFTPFFHPFPSNYCAGVAECSVATTSDNTTYPGIDSGDDFVLTIYNDSKLPGKYLLKATYHSAPPAPEPDIWVLMMVGLGLTGAGVRGRKLRNTSTSNRSTA